MPQTIHTLLTQYLSEIHNHREVSGTRNSQ